MDFNNFFHKKKLCGKPAGKFYKEFRCVRKVDSNGQHSDSCLCCSKEHVGWDEDDLFYNDNGNEK